MMMIFSYVCLRVFDSRALAEHDHCRRYYFGHPKLAVKWRLGLSNSARVQSNPTMDRTKGRSLPAVGDIRGY
jgi:hypothetical protein